MADIEQSSSSASISATSYETALCLIPPHHLWQDIDKLRSLYDKGYGKWPPHINLIYPFVAPESLPRAKIRIGTSLRNTLRDEQITVTLDQAGHFDNRNQSTVYLCGKACRNRGALDMLRSVALQAIGQDISPCNFHLTIGQSENDTASARDYLLGKVDLIPSFSFDVLSLAILVRDRSPSYNESSNKMHLWGYIDLADPLPHVEKITTDFWVFPEKSLGEPRDFEEEESESTELMLPHHDRQIKQGVTFQYTTETGKWSIASVLPQNHDIPSLLSVSSYNVLIDSEFPPARDRDPLLISTILSNAALADIFVLQEVSDDFLSYILSNDEIRQRFCFTSHGPPSQPDIGPLPSLRNIVILSQWYFDWEFVPFHRRHKGAVVATFPSVHAHLASTATPLVVAGVHLTCGLTDGSVAAKKVQLQNLVKHLKQKYTASPWIIAGDFNITTSKFTIEEAVKNRSISPQTTQTLDSIESMLSEIPLLDAWAVAKVEGTDYSGVQGADDLFEGEEGATFNPRENVLAAATSGTSNKRPQRYDRILFRAQGLFNISRFNHFGLPQTHNGPISVPSDHVGIRASLKFVHDSHKQATSQQDVLQHYVVEHKHASTGLSRNSDIVDALANRSMFPTAEDEEARKNALLLIKDILLGSHHQEDPSMSDIPMIIVPVGSYALGVWTPTSDIDCLCIGSISSKTFFKLARQRIHRAESQGVRLLRKVEANTGTMLELSVKGVNLDLQYCPAAGVVKRWAEFPDLHPSDPVFNLPIHALRKLKAVRDLNHIQRTLLSIASFRLAYLLIKLWAMQRGIYSAKFGYLGGIHITLLLSWVCKRLAHGTGSVSTGDLIVSFFHHYAHFDWQNEMVFDAFFQKSKPRYQRSHREPMVVLGFHSPNSNIAHTATLPSMQVLITEFRRASNRLSVSNVTWDEFFGDRLTLTESAALPPHEKDFLTSHERYARIDIQYWGRTLSKGRGLVGWVESRCVNLVVDIHKSLSHLSVRIWPARFVDSEVNDNDTYYHGCYLIGISRTEELVIPESKERRAHATQAIQKTFDRFLDLVRAEGNHYDANSCWVGASLAKPDDVKGLRLDDRDWGDYIAELEPDSEDDDEEEDSDDAPRDAQATRKLPVKQVASTATPVSSAKLRPASDVLNRLRWDPNLDPSDYIVGYEDRFLGAKETTLERWKTEQTDEEFIPQHRILYFKRKGENGSEIVWERATRIDKIFASGASNAVVT